MSMCFADAIEFASSHFGYIVASSVAVDFDVFQATTHFAQKVAWRILPKISSQSFLPVMKLCPHNREPECLENN